MRRVLCCPRSRVNILIWTSRKSVDHETNDRVMVHGDGRRADGRSSSQVPEIGEMLGPRDSRPARASWGLEQCSRPSGRSDGPSRNQSA